MPFFAIGIERSFDVPVQCPHHADPREHHWAAERCDHDQGFHSAVVCSTFESLVIVVAGVLKGDQRSTAGRGLAHRRCEMIPTNALSQIQVHRSGGQDITLAAASRNDRSASAPT
jgi:hypothetical protein